jgi:hypothetical protein
MSLNERLREASWERTRLFEGPALVMGGNESLGWRARSTHPLNLARKSSICALRHHPLVAPRSTPLQQE